MEYRKFDNTYIVRLDPGEEILEQVKALSLKEGICLAPCRVWEPSTI